MKIEINKTKGWSAEDYAEYEKRAKEAREQALNNIDDAISFVRSGCMNATPARIINKLREVEYYIMDYTN